MSSELETLGAASVGSLSTTRTADLSGQPCRNCGEMVEQRHCPRCGQLAASFHRPFISLIFESINDAMALDGRISRTLPLLLFRPGVLTRRYNEGKRARYVPPFRLFLLSSLIFYFIVFALLDGQSWTSDPININGDAQRELTDEEMAELEKQLNEAGIGTSGSFFKLDSGEENASAGLESPEAASAPEGSPTDADSEEETSEIEERLRRIADNPKLLFMAIQDWAPRLSLLLVPLSMLTLALMYFWKRRLYTYNHAIHAFHLHTWMYLAGALTVLVSQVTGPGVWAVFVIIMPIYVILSLRGAYGTGFIMGFLRMCLLFTVWSVGLTLLTAFTFIASVFSV